MKIRNLWLGFVGLCLPVLAQHLDVQGITLGETIQQALATIGPGYVVRTATLPDRAFVAVTAERSGAGPAAGRDSWFFETLHGKLAYVAHSIHFEHGKEPSSSLTAQRLNAKYGKQNGLSPGIYAYDASGRQNLDLLQATKCSMLSRAQQRFPAQGGPGTVSALFGAEAARSIQSYCGEVVSAGYNLQGPSTPDFSVSLVDHRPFKAELDKAIQQTQERQRRDVEKAKQNGSAPF